MPKINLRCKKCQKEYSVGDFLPPSKGKCPKCGTANNEIIRSLTSHDTKDVGVLRSHQ